MRRKAQAQRSLRSNTRGLLGVLVVVALLPILVGASVIEHRSDNRDADRKLAFEASEHTSSLTSYFGQARSLTRLLGQNPAFREFYAAPGTNAAKIKAGGPALREANAALAHLEDLFPGMIGEACLIDRSGAEIARAVKGKVAPTSDLSPDETEAPFFAPTFAMRQGDVFHSEPYLSPDTNEWVIANSTPIPTPGRARAIVHFEITIESLRKAAAADAVGGYDILVVDSRTGAVVLDGRHLQRPGGKLGRPDDRRFTTLVSTMTDEQGTLEVDGYRAAYERLTDRARNANDWILVAVGQEKSASWLRGIGISELGVLAALLLSLGAALGSLRSSQRELTAAALDDQLTGLGNRRRLLSDLGELLATGSGEHVLVLCDLDGFKSYNDAYGHPAGDALLARLGSNLGAAVERAGRAYRMGGDEFCVLATLRDEADLRRLLGRLRPALTEHGEGFSVTVSQGAVRLPSEAATPSEALGIADRRMYAAKASGRTSASRQSTDVLLQVLSERNVELGDHGSIVADLAGVVGRQLGLPEVDVAEVERAAELHDVGKIAIPDAILSKPEKLAEDEWAFIRRHPLIGERILSAAPSLLRVAQLVRMSHERFDGKGYPDGREGQAIPIGARIILVCDAFHAMTSDRPYRSGMSAELALEELRRCAGTQFDPAVVEAFCTAVELGQRRPTPAEQPTSS
jgi:diguanylate cyclase (GGDEF)-like protein